MKIICIGRNYVKHIEELQNERPEEPVVFLKPDSAILLKQHPFVIPEFTDEVHHEVEILVKINKVGKYIEPKFAHNYYDEIGLGIDFTARDLQVKLKEKATDREIQKANTHLEKKLFKRGILIEKESNLESIREKTIKNHEELKKMFIVELDKALEDKSQNIAAKYRSVP
jgi:hypothetical protein